MLCFLLWHQQAVVQGLFKEAEPAWPPALRGHTGGEVQHPAAEVADQATAAGTAATEVANVPAIPEGTRIVLTAISDSWVEVRETVTDTWVWGKLLRAGESYPVPDRPNLKLKTGNAGGLTIAVDGTDVPPVGESGEVVRNVLLDPDRLKAGTAASR